MTELDRRFATALTHLSDAPPALAEAIRQQDGMCEVPDFLIFSPAFTTMDIHRPASLLALTTTHWAVALQDSDVTDHPAAMQTASSIGNDYGHTLAVELSILLLDGRLAIHTKGTESGAFIIYFNTVMEQIYRNAAFFVVNQIVSKSPSRRESLPQRRLEEPLELSMKFSNALARFTPPHTTVEAYTAWSAVVGGFHRQLAPAGMLVRTDNELILISDEAAAGGFFANPQQNLGYVVTYMPHNRISALTCTAGKKLATMEITLVADDTTESIIFLVPPDVSSTVASVAT